MIHHFWGISFFFYVFYWSFSTVTKLADPAPTQGDPKLCLPSWADSSQLSAKLIISPSSTFNLNWENISFWNLLQLLQNQFSHNEILFGNDFQKKIDMFKLPPVMFWIETTRHDEIMYCCGGNFLYIHLKDLNLYPLRRSSFNCLNNRTWKWGRPATFQFLK